MIQVKKKRWEDITISDYKEIINITQKELDSDLEKSISILAILCECTEDDLYSMNANKLYKLLDEIEWVKQPYKFNHNWSSKHITINGIKYDVVVDINKFTVAQYADLQVFWDKRDNIDYMAKLLTLFIIVTMKNGLNGICLLKSRLYINYSLVRAALPQKLGISKLLDIFSVYNNIHILHYGIMPDVLPLGTCIYPYSLIGILLLNLIN